MCFRVCREVSEVEAHPVREESAWCQGGQTLQGFTGQSGLHARCDGKTKGEAHDLIFT